MKRILHLSIYCIAASAVLIAAVVTSFNEDLLKAQFLSKMHFIIGLLVLCWIYHVCVYIHANPEKVKNFLYRSRWGILAATLLTVSVFISAPPYFRVLQDETNLLSVSRSMLNDRSVDNVTQAQEANFNLTDENYAFPKRPFLYPFSVFALHLLLGFHAYNAFLVNAFALWGVLFIAFLIARSFTDNPGACGIMLLMAAQPVVTQTAASGGMEMTFALGCFACLLSLWLYLKNSSSVRFEFLWLHLLLFMQIRYESSIYSIAVISALLLLKQIKLTYFKEKVWYALTPLFLLPIYWQRFFIEVDLEIPNGEKAFTVAHFFSHSWLFIRSLFRFDFFLPYANIVNILGVAGLVYFVYLLMIKKAFQQKQYRIFFGIALGWFALYWIILNAHYGLFLHEPVGARLWTFAALVFSGFSGWLILRFASVKTHAVRFFLMGLGLFLIYHPLSIRNYFSNGIVSPREFRIVLNELKKFRKKDLLIIANPSAQYVSHQFATLKFERANVEIAPVLQSLIDRRYQDIVVVQNWDIEKNTATPETTLSKVYKTDAFFELKITPNKTVRLSRVVL